MGKLLSCYWKLSINGVELDPNKRKCIESLDIQELCDGSDSLTLKVSDPEFLFIESNLYVRDATVSATIRWHGDTHPIKFNGYVSAIDIDFPDSGYPILSIFCLDESHTMNRVKKKRSWDNVTRADVVTKIAKEYGYKCVIEPNYDFTKESTISQSNVTDIAFCENLASEEKQPFMCKLIKGTLYYVKKGLLKDPVSTVYYKKFPYDVVSFSPRITKETVPEEVSSADINTHNKSVDSAKASNKDTPREVQGKPIDTSDISSVYNSKLGRWDMLR